MYHPLSFPKAFYKDDRIIFFPSFLYSKSMVDSVKEKMCIPINFVLPSPPFIFLKVSYLLLSAYTIRKHPFRVTHITVKNFHFYQKIFCNKKNAWEKYSAYAKSFPMRPRWVMLWQASALPYFNKLPYHEAFLQLSLSDGYHNCHLWWKRLLRYRPFRSYLPSKVMCPLSHF